MNEKNCFTICMVSWNLQCSWEIVLHKTNERKHKKRRELVEKCWDKTGREAGRWTMMLVVDSCREIGGWSLCIVLSWLGCREEVKKRSVQSSNGTIEKAPWWVWIKRADPWVVVGCRFVRVGADQTRMGGAGWKCLILNNTKPYLVTWEMRRLSSSRRGIVAFGRVGK